MTHPKAYDPQPGQMFHILCMNPSYDRAWEHCDYAKDRAERDYLVGEYRLAYGSGYRFKAILQPVKYWPRRVKVTA